MSTRVLVVEDDENIYQNYLMRIFGELLSMEKFEFTRVGNIYTALEALEEDWDIILMDYHLGVQYVERKGMHFRNGADLVAYRRTLEEADPKLSKPQIAGIAGSTVCNTKIVNAGANAAFLKLEVPEIAAKLKDWM